ncbi:MAG: hypothetical protein Kow00129_13090 [Thermoleophilia bacterium]
MIISQQEIRNVLDLTAPATGGAGAAGAAPPARERGRTVAQRGRGYDSSTRSVRIKSLKEMLAAGAYEIPEDMLADKIIGRALCDQISRLYEARTG